jgi:hypothetical protein
MNDDPDRPAPEEPSSPTAKRLDMDRRPRRRPEARRLVEKGRIVISDADGRAVVSLNESAAAVWELCDGTTSVAEMVAAICDLSSIAPSRASTDVVRTLKALEKAGLIVADASRVDRAPDLPT